MTEEGVLGGTARAFAAQAITSLFTAILVVFLLRTLGADDYGLFALALSVSALAQLVADFGVSFSAAKLIAERRHDPRAVAHVLAAALRLKLALATVAALGLVALAGPLAEVYDEPDVEWPLRLIAVSMAAESVIALYLAAFGALRRLALNVRVIFVESLLEMGASIGLVLAGTGVAGAAAGRGIGYAVGAAFAIVLTVRLVGRGVVALRHGDRDLNREIAGYGRSLFITNSAYQVFSVIDVQLIGLLLNSAAVGVFSAPLRLIAFLGYVGQSVANAVSPRMARRGQEPDVRSFLGSLRWLLVLHTFLVVPMVVWAEPLVELVIGPEFDGAVEVTRLLAPYLFLRGLGPLFTTTVNFLGEASRRIPIVLAALALNVVVDLLLIPEIGVEGAAIGTSVAYALYVPAHFAICRRELDLAVRPLLLTQLRALLAGAAMAGVLLVAGTGELTLPEWILGAAGGPAAFLAVLMATGELRSAQLRAAVAAVRARAGR